MTDFPTAYITGMTRSLRSAVLATESPFSFVQQVQDTGGERWEFNIDVMVESLGFEVFANTVINKRQPFHLIVPKARAPRASHPTLLNVFGAAGANTIQVSGGWNSAVLSAGDFISFMEGGRHRLHQLTQSASSGSLLHITPRLRGNIEAATPIEVITPRVTLRATNKAPATIGHVIHQFSIEAVEAL